MRIRFFVFFLFCLNIFQSLNAQVNLTNGLVAYYPFTGSTNDVSGNNHHATNTGGGLATTDRFGNANSAWYFDGIDDYLRVNDNGAFSTSSMSISFWFRTEANQTQVMIGKRDWVSANNSEFGVNLYPSTRSVRSFMVGNNRSCNDVVTGTTSQAIQSDFQQDNCHNGWHHVAIIFNNGVHKLFLDGQLLNNSTSNFNSRSTCNTELRFGVWWSGDPNWFKGKLDEIRWYNRALNDHEVLTLFGSYSATESLKLDFTFKQDACDPKKISFVPNSNSLNNPSWYFGDGNSSTVISPIHTYASYGTYSVKLKAQNPLGCFDSIQKEIFINVRPSNVLISTRDTSICLGQPLTLNASTLSPTFCWQSSQGAFNSNDTILPINPVNDVTYYFTTQNFGPNLIVNSDFSQGNTGFITDYSLATPNLLEGQYWIGTNPTSWNGGMNSCSDHTTGSGNMLMVNGSPVAGAKVWSQTINVSPNTNYSFSAWIQALYPLNPAQLRFSINNSVLGDNINATLPPCQWNRYQTIWNSGNQTSAVITIVNNNTNAGGNDFALDDIPFAKVEMVYDSVKVFVSVPPNVKVGNDTVLCANTPFQLSATGANFYSWSPSTGLSNPAIANPVATISDTIQYIVTGWNINSACFKKDTINLYTASNSSFNLSPSAVNACEGNTVSLIAYGGHTYNWFTTNHPNLSNNSQYSFPALVSDTIKVVIQDTVCFYQDTLESVIRVGAKPIVTLSKTNDISCATPHAQLSASGGETFSWYPNNNISSATNPVITVNPPIDTWYRVTASNGGCATDDSILVKVNFNDSKGPIYVPTAFTPNKDGNNDSFRPLVNGPVGRYEFSIYNRWGELVFRTNDPQRSWDGTYKSIEQPAGMYVYWIRSDAICSPNFFKKGTILLIR